MENEQQTGVVDIHIKFDTKDGGYHLSMEENGLPTQIPLYILVGILNHVAMQSSLYVEDENTGEWA